MYCLKFNENAGGQILLSSMYIQVLCDHLGSTIYKK